MQIKQSQTISLSQHSYKRVSLDSNSLTQIPHSNTQNQLKSPRNSIPKSLIRTTVELSYSDTDENQSVIRLFSDKDLDTKSQSSTKYKYQRKPKRLPSGAISPGFSQTSYDLDCSKENIQIRGSVSYSINEIPNICLALRRQPTYQESYKNLSNDTSLQVSPVKIRANQSKSLSVLVEFDDKNIHSIWDDDEEQYGPIKEETIEFLTNLEQFLILYKMRQGTFPGRRRHIENERIILMAINLARINKKLYKKYFPNKDVVFNDDCDYTRSKPNRHKNKQQTQIVTPLYQFISS